MLKAFEWVLLLTHKQRLQSPNAEAPQMPPQFTTSVTTYRYAAGLVGDGKFVMDVLNKRYVQEQNWPWLGYTLNETELALPDRDFTFVNGLFVLSPHSMTVVFRPLR